MPSLLDALEVGARRLFCIQMGTASAFGNVLGGGGSAAAGLAIGAAGRLYEMVCDRPPPGPDEPPFSGGQCQGVMYSVTLDWKVNWYDTEIGIDREIDSANAKSVMGPVGFCGFERVGAYGLRLVWNGANGQQVENIFGDNPRFQNQQTDMQNITVARQDGQPDNCGDAPPSYPVYLPGDNTASNYPITWNDNDNNEYNDNIDVSFGFPVVLPDGTVNIPISFNFDVNPNLNIEGNLNLPDFNLDLNFGGNPGLGGSECNPGEDDYVVDDGDDGFSNPPGDIPPPDPTPGSPERRRILRGCVVNTSEVGPSIGQIHQDFNPDIRIPNLGYVNFLVRVGEIQGWSEDIPVKNLNQVIRCPWEGGALMVRGTPRNGVAWSIKNIYTRQSFDPRFPPEPG